MLIVQQGNKQLRINETDKDVYIALGYSVLDEDGKVIELGNAVSTSAIKAENTSLKAKLAEYKENIEKLDQFEEVQKEIEALKAEKETLVAELEPLKAENASLKEQLEAATKKTK